MINLEIQPKLTFVANQLGGMAYVELLPASTLEQIVMHEDDCIIIGNGFANIDLYEPDLDKGYKVYNSNFKLIYSHNKASGLTEGVWGKTKKDLLLINELSFGNFAYLKYETKSKEISIPRLDINRRYVKDGDGKVIFDVQIEPGVTRIILLVRV